MTKSCLENDLIESKKENQKYKWTLDEIQLLQQAVQQCGCNWFEIAKQLPRRNPNQCAQKWKNLKGQRSRENKFWTNEEDQKLINLISKYGKHWTLVAKYMDNRNNKQCRDRFMNTLDPTLEFEQFSKEEDNFIYLKFVELGPKWSTISKELIGRSENQVKNRFYTHIRAHYLYIKNPYYTKVSSEYAKVVLANTRENHLNELQKQIEENQSKELESPNTEECFSEFYEFSSRYILGTQSYSPQEIDEES